MRTRLLIPLLALMAGLLATPAHAEPAHAEPAHAKQKYAGYLFSYFTGEGTADGEQIRMALSRGNDPTQYRTLNDGKPVLT